LRQGRKAQYAPVAAPQGTQSSLRLLAPAALVLFAVALLIVLTTSSVDDGGSSSRAREESGQTTQRTRTTQTGSRRDRLGQDVYTVKTGDTLAGISTKVGIPVEKILELNPDLDPQALVSGQKIKLRE
jgi:LysM repeat protein